jgi:hypothetical protein
MKFLSEEYLAELKEESILLKGAMQAAPYQNTTLDPLFTQIRVNNAKIKFLEEYLHQ